MRDNIEAVAKAFGAKTVSRNVPYPGWAPNINSEVLQVGEIEVLQVGGMEDPESLMAEAAAPAGLLTFSSSAIRLQIKCPRHALSNQITKDTFARELGSEPHIGAIHAGLECGLLGEKFPGMDMVRASVGGARWPHHIPVVIPIHTSTGQLWSHHSGGTFTGRKGSHLYSNPLLQRHSQDLRPTR